MFKEDLIKYFKNQHGIVDFYRANGFQITKAAVSAWKSVIPLNNALLIEKLTNGALTCDIALYKSKRTKSDAITRPPTNSGFCYLRGQFSVVATVATSSRYS